MESYQTQIMKKHDLGIFKESMKIPLRNPRFVLFSFLASLPLFSAALLHETALQRTLIQLAQALSAPPTPTCSDDMPFCYYHRLGPLDYIETTIQQISQNYLSPGLFYFGIVLLTDFLATVAVVNWASTIYIYENTLIGISNFKNVGGAAATSAYVALLGSLTQIGFVSLAGQIWYYGFSGNFNFWSWSVSGGLLVAVLFGAPFVGLFAKYEEWSGVWNVAVVMSVVEGEEKKGIVAIGVGAYVSRGCRIRGAVLAVAFWAWRVGLRALGLYLVWGVQGKDGGVTAINGVMVGLGCLGNVMKWVVFVVYFCDCKKRFLEKKVDGEEKVAAAVTV